MATDMNIILWKRNASIMLPRLQNMTISTKSTTLMEYIKLHSSTIHAQPRLIGQFYSGGFFSPVKSASLFILVMWYEWLLLVDTSRSTGTSTTHTQIYSNILKKLSKTLKSI